MRSASAVLFTLIILLSTAGNLPDSRAFHDEQVILDGRDDVILYRIRERSASGQEDIDIVSLETQERITRVEAYLNLKTDISSDLGYLYTLSIGGISTTYDNDTFSIVRISDGEDLSGEVDAEVSGRRMSVTLPKSVLTEGNREINGSAVKYTLASGKFEEYYFDIVEGFGQGTVTPYQVSLDDPDGDVRFSFVEAGTGSDPGIDIIRMVIKKSGQWLEIGMFLAGTPFTSGTEVYRFLLGDRIFFYDIEGVIQETGEGTSVVNHRQESNALYIELEYSSPATGILIGGRSRSEGEEGAWQEDSCPERSDFQLDVFPFATGSTLDVLFRISETGEAELKISSYDYDPALESLIVESCDLDSSGAVEVEEMDHLLKPIEMSLMETPLLMINGEAPEMVVVFNHSGILDSSSLRIDLAVSISAGGSGKEERLVEILPLREVSAEVRDDEILSDLYIELPEGMVILALTISPGELGNHLSIDRRTIETSSTGATDFNSITAGISFEVKEKPPEEETENNVAYEDVPWWVYVVAVVIVLIVFLMAIRFTLRKDPPPEDY
jgi:hypothetical protein